MNSQVKKNKNLKHNASHECHNEVDIEEFITTNYYLGCDKSPEKRFYNVSISENKIIITEYNKNGTKIYSNLITKLYNYEKKLLIIFLVFFNFTVFSQIQGQNPVCQYQSGVQYYYVSAQPIQWAVWNVPQGSTIVSTSINSFYIGNVRWYKAILVVNFGNAAVSGNILLNIKIQLYDGFNVTFAVNVISTSSTNGNALTGINNVY
ncbi:MAG: hypothetical protein NT048_03025 [Flavobacterium sp.]|nr:hypothetical protein [Flavobacterium sp.]